MRYLVKHILIAFLVIFLAFSYSVEAQTDSEKIEEAYKWLEQSKINDGWGSIESNSFSVRALKNYNNNLANTGADHLLGRSQNDGECWPSGGCRVKDTALAIIALDEMGKDVTKAKNWLLDQQNLFLDSGNWFIQTEILSGLNNGTCSVEYTSGSNAYTDTIEVDEDRKVSLKQSSVCLEVLSTYPWWTNVKDSCLETEFFVSCSESEWFANTLFIDEPTYIPFEGINGPGIITINSKCFPNTPGSSQCEYDATMWASYALDLLNEEVETRAYLESLAETNKPLSYAFLYLIYQESNFASKLGDEQLNSGSWGSSNQIFNTALSYFSVREVSLENLDLLTARDWILDNQNQDFSWGSGEKQRDTAAVLLGLFPKGSSGSSVQRCDSFDKTCCLRSNVEFGAETFNELSCANTLTDSVCVSKDNCIVPQEEVETCSNSNGICCARENSIGTNLGELDCGIGEICTTSCDSVKEEVCEDVGFCCVEAAEGATRHFELDNTCSFNDICASSCSDVSSGENGGIWKYVVWFLAILVIVGGIVLALVLFKKKGEGKKDDDLPSFGNSRGIPPAPVSRRPVMRRPIPRPVPIRPIRTREVENKKKKNSRTEEELEKTLKELENIKKF